MNLKQVLMELGNRLVLERRFLPAQSHGPHSTKPIDDFTRWLNNTPEAIELLADMGIEWPVVKRRNESQIEH